MFADLHRVHEDLVASVDARLTADCALTFGRFEVLSVIGREGTCRVNDISEDLGITWGGTSKIVDRLEAARLCKRRPNPEDGRSSLIELTPAGRRALTKATKVMGDELDNGVGTVLSGRALAQLTSACAALRRAAHGVTSERPTAVQA